MFWFERSERPKPRARPAGKFRQEFYRKASLVGAVKFGSTAQVGPNFLPKRALKPSARTLFSIELGNLLQQHRDTV